MKWKDAKSPEITELVRCAGRIRPTPTDLHPIPAFENG